MQTVYENMVPEFLISVINEETVATSDSVMSCVNLATGKFKHSWFKYEKILYFSAYQMYSNKILWLN